MSAETIAPIAEEVGNELGINPWHLMGHAYVESRLVPTAKSPGGKYLGLLQMDRGLVARFAPGNPLDPKTNLTAGGRYYLLLKRMYGGSAEIALAAYNYGSGKINGLLRGVEDRTWEALRDKLPARVRGYVLRVIQAANQYRSLWS